LRPKIFILDAQNWMAEQTTDPQDAIHALQRNVTLQIPMLLNDRSVTILYCETLYWNDQVLILRSPMMVLTNECCCLHKPHKKTFNKKQTINMDELRFAALRAMSVNRSTLEQITKAMNATGIDLASKIDNLKQQGKISNQLESKFHDIRKGGNDMLHNLPTVKPEDAAKIFKTVEEHKVMLSNIEAFNAEFNDIVTRYASVIDTISVKLGCNNGAVTASASNANNSAPAVGAQVSQPANQPASAKPKRKRKVDKPTADEDFSLENLLIDVQMLKEFAFNTPRVYLGTNDLSEDSGNIVEQSSRTAKVDFPPKYFNPMLGKITVACSLDIVPDTRVTCYATAVTHNGFVANVGTSKLKGVKLSYTAIQHCQQKLLLKSRNLHLSASDNKIDVSTSANKLAWEIFTLQVTGVVEECKMYCSIFHPVHATYLKPVGNTIKQSDKPFTWTISKRGDDKYSIGFKGSFLLLTQDNKLEIVAKASRANKIPTFEIIYV